MAKYLIIGNSAGGIGAAEAIRQVDKKGSLTIISEEPYPAYSRPLIAEFLADETSLEQMLYRPREFYRNNDIQVILGKKVVGINLEAARVRLENGQELAFEKLLLAMGGKPFVPPMEGLSRRGVYTFTTLGDAERIKNRLSEGAKKAVVIGGGLIGISVTESLIKQGVEVTVVELMDRILGTTLDPMASDLAQKAVGKAGIKIITGHTIKEIIGKQEKGSSVSGVILDTGEVILCNLVVIAIGVAPRTELVTEKGMGINRGIAVDRHMHTNLPNVYACGDVAEAYDLVHQTNRLTPIWPNACLGGRVAGFNMAGVEKKYPGGTAMNALKSFGLAIVSAGLVNPQDGNGYQVLTRSKPEKGIYQKIILKDDLIVGMIQVGEIETSGVIYGLMKDRVNVSRFKDTLLCPDFGLIYFPKELRKERLGAV